MTPTHRLGRARRWSQPRPEAADHPLGMAPSTADLHADTLEGLTALAPSYAPAHENLATRPSMADARARFQTLATQAAGATLPDNLGHDLPSARASAAGSGSGRGAAARAARRARRWPTSTRSRSAFPS